MVTHGRVQAKPPHKAPPPPKPPSFKLGRSNLFGEQGTVFEYMISPEVAGAWCRWEEQMALVSVKQSGERLVVPTSESLKQEFFVKLAIKHEFPLTLVGPSGTGKTFLTCGLIAGSAALAFMLLLP